MTLRVGLEIVGAGARFVLPREVDERPVRIGRKGDVDADLPASLLVFRKNGRLLVSSASNAAPITLGGAPLPTWFVPLPLPCTLAAGGVEVRLFIAVVRTPPHGIRPVSATAIPIPPLPIHDTYTDTGALAFASSAEDWETQPRASLPAITTPPRRDRASMGPLAGARGALDAATFGGVPPFAPKPAVLSFDLPQLGTPPSEPPLESTRRFHLVTAPAPLSKWNAPQILRDAALAFVAEWRASTDEAKLALAAMLIGLATVMLLLLAR